MASTVAAQHSLLSGGSLHLSRAPLASVPAARLRWGICGRSCRPAARKSPWPICSHKEDNIISGLKAWKESAESLTEKAGEDYNEAHLQKNRTQLLALLLGFGLVLGSAEAAMALGPEGPLLEEFWDNMRRYGLYFLTVATGGIYSILQPIVDLLRNPVTAVLAVIAITGFFFLLYLTLNTMLGVTAFDYKYA